MPFGGKSPFNAEVWYVNTTAGTEHKWGTAKPISTEDPKYGILVSVRAFGQYAVRIDDPEQFFRYLSANLSDFTGENLRSFFKGRVVSFASIEIVKALRHDEISFLDASAYLDVISERCRKTINETMQGYGITLTGFYISSLNIPDGDPSLDKLKEAKNKAMYIKQVGRDIYQFDRNMDVMEGAAKNEGSSSSVMGAGIGMGIGAGIGAPMGNAMAGMSSQISPEIKDAPPPPPPSTSVSYYVYLNGTQYGPYPEADLITYVKDGRISAEAHVWTQGMSGWQALSGMPDLMAKINGNSNTPPPPPPGV